MALLQFLHEEDGVTAIEYALVAALIAVAILVAVRALGGSIEANFVQVNSAVDSA